MKAENLAMLWHYPSALNEQNEEVDKVAVEISTADVVPDQVAGHVHKSCSHSVIIQDTQSQTAGKNILKRLSTLIRRTTKPKKENPLSPSAKANGME